MTLSLDTQKLEAAIIAEAADQVLNDKDGDVVARILDEVRDRVESRINKIFAERAEAVIQEAIERAIREGFEREYTQVNSFGKPTGEPTTIAKELERLVSGYWNARVDRSGRPTDSSYGSMTRAEFTMLQICGADFGEQMKAAALNVTGHLKDGLRNQMAQQMDKILNDLFKVKSLQDQGKAAKPY